MKRLFRAILAMSVITVSLVNIENARADPLAPPSFKDSEWRVDLTPYLMIPFSISGDTTVAGQTTSLDFDASDLPDLLDLLNFAFSGRVEIWKQDIGLILDGYYVDLNAGGSVQTPGSLPIGVSIDADIRQFYLDGLVSYRLINKPYNAEGDVWSLELMGGLRYNYLKQVIDLKVTTGLGPGASTRLGGNATWVDPIVGTRVAVALNERWTAGARADIGGFGISDTDSTWSITGGFNYRRWEKTSLKFGWRAYSLDYSTTISDGIFAYDVVQHGPFLAVTFALQ